VRHNWELWEAKSLIANVKKGGKMSKEKCPYCGCEIEIDHDDGIGYEEDMAHQQECSECGKMFIYFTTMSFSYALHKADCLNEEGKHSWKPTICFPEEFTKMRCEYCKEEREPTEEEFKKIIAEPICEDCGNSMKVYYNRYKCRGCHAEIKRER
jgi:hypothetical protein